jgi:hypothetical protein
MESWRVTIFPTLWGELQIGSLPNLRSKQRAQTKVHSCMQVNEVVERKYKYSGIEGSRVAFIPAGYKHMDRSVQVQRLELHLKGMG